MMGIELRRDFSVTTFAQKIKSKLKKEPEPTVGVLRMAGMIADGRGGGRQRINFNSLEKQIDKSFKHKNLKAVCLRINSPGGSPVQSELIAKRSIFSPSNMNTGGQVFP